MEENKIILKKGKETPFLHRHHWIFSGAVDSAPRTSKGEILPVYSATGDLLGHAMYNPKVSIAGRMVSFGNQPPLDAINTQMLQAVQLRKMLFDPTITNGYRVINGEGDCLPGLVVDMYAGHAAIQIHSLGMEQIKKQVIEQLLSLLQPLSIYEKSATGARQEEGLPPLEGPLFGSVPEYVHMIENGLHFAVSLRAGQKTGFFLDHRESRKRIGELAKGRRVLNGFSYSGGFSVYALAGGAHHVVSVDTSLPALKLAEQNIALNQLPGEKHTTIQEDLFSYLKNHSLPYDLVILDPPAFAKKRNDLDSACRGYIELNRLALRSLPQGSLLLTCSCSAPVDLPLFQKLIFQAAAGTHRQIQIIGRHQLAADHPINLYHPETEYLKSLLLYISNKGPNKENISLE